MRPLVLALVMSTGCSSPSIVTPNVDPATPAASQGPASSNAPLIATSTSAAAPAGDASAAGTGTAEASATARHTPMGKPTSFGGGIPGECINCPPTGCPKSCETLMKGK